MAKKLSLYIWQAEAPGLAMFLLDKTDNNKLAFVYVCLPLQTNVLTGQKNRQNMYQISSWFSPEFLRGRYGCLTRHSSLSVYYQKNYWLIHLVEPFFCLCPKDLQVRLSKWHKISQRIDSPFCYIHEEKLVIWRSQYKLNHSFLYYSSKFSIRTHLSKWSIFISRLIWFSSTEMHSVLAIKEFVQTSLRKAWIRNIISTVLPLSLVEKCSRVVVGEL